MVPDAFCPMRTAQSFILPFAESLLLGTAGGCSVRNNENINSVTLPF